MLERLERDFVNAWILHQDLEPFFEADPEVARVARTVHAAYQYPVDSQVLSSTGELLGQLCANELSGDGQRRYMELLDEATGR